MTDNEIIKALGCCGEIDRLFCDGCTYKSENDCVVALARDAHDLINRLKAEIERLNANMDAMVKEHNRFADIGKMYSEVRAEAIKEFAERLLATKIKPEFPWDDFFVTETAINDLVKEITEGKQ